MAIKYDNCKDCHSRCIHAGKDREFICINGVSCKITKENPQSNADRIRSMSDEELASKISHQCISSLCDIVCGGDCKAFATLNKTSHQRCVEIVLDWLKRPAE